MPARIGIGSFQTRTVQPSMDFIIWPVICDLDSLVLVLAVAAERRLRRDIRPVSGLSRACAMMPKWPYFTSPEEGKKVISSLWRQFLCVL